MVRLFFELPLRRFEGMTTTATTTTQNNDKKRFDVEIREKQIVDESEINQTTFLPPFHNPQNQKYLRRKNS